MGRFCLPELLLYGSLGPLGFTEQPFQNDPRPGDVKHSCADIRRARELLKFEPQVSFADGLSRAIEYYKSL